MSADSSQVPDSLVRPDRGREQRGAVLEPRESAWLLRVGAILGALAAMGGLFVGPGIRGNAGEHLVVAIDRSAAALTYLFLGALIVLLARGVASLPRATRVRHVWLVVMSVAAATTMIVALVAARERLRPALAIPMAGAASCVAWLGFALNIRPPHTRAVAGVLGAFASASLFRIAAWEFAVFGGDHANMGIYNAGRVFATISVASQGIGLLVATVWIGTRSRLTGQLFSFAALVAAIALTWGASQGVHADARAWEAVMHNALGDGPVTPPPFALSAVAALFACISVLFAFVAAVQPRQVPMVVGAMSLAIVSAGAFDVPLQALAASAAAIWLTVASDNGRAMWSALRPKN